MGARERTFAGSGKSIRLRFRIRTTNPELYMNDIFSLFSIVFHSIWAALQSIGIRMIEDGSRIEHTSEDHILFYLYYYVACETLNLSLPPEYHKTATRKYIRTIKSLDCHCASWNCSSTVNLSCFAVGK